MKTIYIILLAQIIISMANAREIFVSPRGNDSGEGTLGDPIKTIQRARDIILTDAAENSSSEFIVWMADGVHLLTEALEFNSADPGMDHIVIHFRALPNTSPAISGGMEVNNWEQSPSGFWTTTLPGEILPRELFINNQRAQRARFPNEGFLRVSKVGDDRRTHFFFEEGNFPIPQAETNTELVLLHDWSISRIPIKDIDRKQNKLTAVDSIGAKQPIFFNLDHWEEHPRYFLENAREFIDMDFEWTWDPGSRVITLKLPDGKTPNDFTIYTPVSPNLLQLTGTKDTPIANIHFQGILFQHSYWATPKLGYCGIQACHFDPRPQRSPWAIVPPAVELTWAKNCTFSNCTFTQLGGSGVLIGRGSKNCKITQSTIKDVSGNGIMIGEGRDRKVNGLPWYKVSPEEVATGNIVENSTISHCGKQFYGAVGIWAGLTAETTLRNNELFELPYTGISIGWMWSPAKTPSRDNHIVGNHIHNIMQVLSDGGGIYSLGLQPGSELSNNHIHDVKVNAGRAESNGIFMDEGTKNVVVSNNLIYNIAKSPLRFHRAQENLVIENILFCTDDNPPIRYNATEAEVIQKVDNLIYTENGSGFEEVKKKWINQK